MLQQAGEERRSRPACSVGFSCRGIERRQEMTAASHFPGWWAPCSIGSGNGSYGLYQWFSKAVGYGTWSTLR